VAVVGCLHGQLSQLYQDIASRDKSEGKQTNLVIVCGDMQTVRHSQDIPSVNIPKKYLQDIGDFAEYYDGKKKVPILTVCIGGNHEASGYLRELMYGGWVCENL